jgi:Cytochrome c554 and c-prime
MHRLYIMLFPAALAATSLAADCERCHPAESQAHASTRHAFAMVPALESAFVKSLPARPLAESEDGYIFTYRGVEKHIVVKATRGSSTSEGLIEWVVGAGQQGQTPLVRSVEGIRESRVSYFPKLHRYGVTVGQAGGLSPGPEMALGLLETSSDAEKCISCHASGITRDLEPTIPGVQCWQCHPGALEHARGRSKLPVNPGKLSAENQVRLCGECHRVTPPGEDADLDNVRFQPLRLMKSRCFRTKALACTSCHPAHQDVRRDDQEYYNAKCRGCHSDQAIHADMRQKGNCIGCHMPQVQLHPALKFTDHFIRVVHAGEPR